MTTPRGDFPRESRPLSGGWVLSYDRSESAYCQAVLVSPEGKAFGPGDLLGVPVVAALRGIGDRTLRSYLAKGQPSAGSGWMRVEGLGWAIFAADAVAI